MKRMTITIVYALALLIPIVAQAQKDEDYGPSAIAGAGVGLAVEGPDTRETFLTQFVGLRVLTPEGAAVYACYQRGTIEGLGIGGNGAKVVLADRWTQLPDFTWLLGLGFLDNIKAIADGTDLKAGLTFEGGITYDASRWIEIGLFGSAWERGVDPLPPSSLPAVSGEVEERRGGRVSWLIMLTGIIKEPLKLVPGL
ncbi:MAG: hypothetical protein AB1752_13915 [Candidatus Zixiibacteriota bacterium]